MRTRESFLALAAELDGDEREIKRLKTLNARAMARITAGAQDVLDYGALGYTIHSLYGITENYFLRISKFFENNLPHDRWHKALVEKMSLEIKGVRPPFLLSSSDRSDALEILKFRHRFRNLYGEDLDPRKTLEIQRICDRFYARFPVLHSEFRGLILEIAEHVV